MIGQQRRDALRQRAGVAAGKAKPCDAVAKGRNLGHMQAWLVMHDCGQPVGHSMYEAQPNLTRIEKGPATIRYICDLGFIGQSAVPQDPVLQP